MKNIDLHRSDYWVTGRRQRIFTRRWFFRMLPAIICVLFYAVLGAVILGAMAYNGIRMLISG